jgi:hypothetical protein
MGCVGKAAVGQDTDSGQNQKYSNDLHRVPDFNRCVAWKPQGERTKQVESEPGQVLGADFQANRREGT